MNADQLISALLKVPGDTEVVMVDFATYQNDIKHVYSGVWPSEPDKPLVMLVAYGAHLPPEGLTDLEDYPDEPPSNETTAAGEEYGAPPDEAVVPEGER